MALFTLIVGGTFITVPALSATATAAVAVGPVTPAPVVPPSYLLVGGMFTVNGLVSTLYGQLYFLRIFSSGVYGPIRNNWFTAARIAEYGNVLQDIVDPCLIFSTYLTPATLGSLSQQGSSQGVLVTTPNNSPPVPPPNPPAPPAPTPLVLPGTIAPGQSIPLDIVIYQDNEFSTIHVYYAFLVTVNGGSYLFVFLVQGARAIFVQYLPDWGDNEPKLTLEFKSDVFQSDQLQEQRTTTLMPRDEGNNIPAEVQHRFDWVYKTEGRQRSTDLYNRLYRGRAKRFAIPFVGEPLKAAADAAGATIVTPYNIGLNSLLWHSDEICRLDTRPGKEANFETKRVSNKNFGTNAITVDAPWETVIPPEFQVFYFVRYVHLTGLRRTSDSDEHQTLAVGYSSTD